MCLRRDDVNRTSNVEGQLLKGATMSASATQTPNTVTVQLDDPFSSLFQPSYDPKQTAARKSAAFANQQINPSHKAQTYVRDLEPVFSDPLLQKPSTLDTQFVPKSDYVKAKRSARDGWLAVMILGSFIAVGTYWIVDRVSSDGTKIVTLTTQVTDLGKQLAAERGVVMARNKEVQVLNEQLQDARRAATAAAKKAK